MTVAAPPVPRSPYKGLAPFEDSEQDALFFFGREREAEVIVANLLASRLTVLYGPSGVGKSSVLQAAVVRRLRADAPGAEIAVLDEWTGEPGLPDPAGEAFLVLDQFEEYFLYHDEGLLLDALPELLARPRVHVLISLREDALAQLDAFQARIPAVLANRLRLEHLDRAAARSAILGPLARWNELTAEAVEIDPELLDAVLDQVAVQEGAASPDRDRIEAPYLQLVLERIWDTERHEGSSRLRLATLVGLGGARAIVRDHLDRALEALAPDEQDLAASMFEHLVTPSGTKIALRAPDLAEYAGVPEDSLRHVLGALTHDRIVHGVDGSDRYEIFHDVLAEPIRTWREQRRLELEQRRARRRQRRLVALAAGALAALVVVAGLAIWALSERGTARTQARLARAHELEATALQQLPIDPERSMLLALDASRLQPGTAAESVLRQALIADRLQLVLSARGPVRTLAYSPDGRLLVAGSDDGQTRIYDASSGAVRGTLRNGGAVTAVAFSRDGSRLATADASGRVEIADPATAKVLLVVRHRAAVTSVSFDPTGRLLLTASADHTARVWDARGGRLLRAFLHPGAVTVARFGPRSLVATVAAAGVGHANARLFDLRTGRLVRLFPEPGVDDVQFSPDGRLLAIANHDGPTYLHVLPTGALVHTLEEHGAGASHAEVFSPDGTFLATAGQDGAVRVWRIADGSRYFFFPGHTQPVVTVAWSPDGHALADASLDGTSQLATITGIGAGTVVARLTGHAGAVRTVAFAPDGRTLATGSDDGTVRVWNAATEEDLRLVGVHEGGVTTASFDPAGHRVVSVGADRTVRIWDVGTSRLLESLRPPAPVADARFSPDGHLVATASVNGTVALWDAATGARLHALRLAARATVVRFSPDGVLLAAGGADGETVLLRVADGGRAAGFRGRGAVVSLAFDDSGTVLLAATRGGATLWDIAHARVRRTIDVPGGVVRAALSPDGFLVATAGADNLGRIYDAATGRLRSVLRGHTAPLTDVAFAAGDQTLVTTSADHTPRVWDSATGALEHALVGHFGPVRTAAFSPDGRWIVTAGTISAGLWPTSSGRLLFYLRGHTAQLTGVSFGPDGRSILTSSRDGTVRVYECAVCVGLEGLVRIADARLERTARALTPAQRARYLPG